jgi:hypothetical protein
LRVLELAAGSNAKVRRSLYVDQHDDVESAGRRRHDNNGDDDYRVGRSGEVWRRGDPHDNKPPPENPVRRI